MQGLSVQELSKITGVTARNIRYYDSVDLFKPSGFAENGYRYYSIEKIEELRLISYLRYAGVSLKEIASHLKNRHIDEYSEILTTQLTKVETEINHLKTIKERLKYRIESLEYIRELPNLNEIYIEELPSRPILKYDLNLKTPLEWEKALLQIEKNENLPPSLIIGEAGFFVDLKGWEKREPTEFIGLFLNARDPYMIESESLEELPMGKWLTLYIKGDHIEASKQYEKLMNYAKYHQLNLASYAIERTLVDHFISSDPELYITEIQIPIKND